MLNMENMNNIKKEVKTVIFIIQMTPFTTNLLFYLCLVTSMGVSYIIICFNITYYLIHMNVSTYYYLH